jgi:hypothetical protein
MRDKWLSAAAVLTLFALATLMLAGCTAGGGAPADSYDWPRWRGPDGDGISKERGWNPQALTDGPKILWKRTIGFGFSGVAIKGSRVYALGSNIPDATVYCLDAESGKDLMRIAPRRHRRLTETLSMPWVRRVVSSVSKLTAERWCGKRTSLKSMVY